MTRRAARLLQALEGSGESAAVSLADHLETVASNGAESSTEQALRDELENMRDWAKHGLDALGKFKLKGAAL